MSNQTQNLDAAAIQAVASLATATKARVEIIPLPREIVPPGATCAAPHLAVSIDGTGKVTPLALDAVIEASRGKPVRRKGTANVFTLESFIDLTNRHANADSAIFVNSDWKSPTLTAVIDYHQRARLEEGATAAGVEGLDPMPLKASSIPGDDPHARFGQHRIHYAFPVSEAWKFWTGLNGESMEQGEFAAFLEDHIHEITLPNKAETMNYEAMLRTRFATPADLMDLARGLEINVEGRVKSKVSLQSGEKQVVFETEHKDAEGKTLTVPGLFMVNVAPFHEGDVITIPARLRYRVAGEGKLSWSYDLYRPDEFIMQRLRSDALVASEETGLPTYDGEPEGGN